MSKHDDKAYIGHIRSAPDSMRSYVRGMAFETFVPPSRLASAGGMSRGAGSEARGSGCVVVGDCGTGAVDVRVWMTSVPGGCLRLPEHGLPKRILNVS